MEISLAAEKLFSVGSFEVTNSVFSAFLIVTLTIVFAIYLGMRLSVANPGKIQLFLEMIIGEFNNMAKDILEKKYSRRLFSFLFTFFVFILFSNWFGLLPIVGPIVIDPHSENDEYTINDLAEVPMIEKAYALDAWSEGLLAEKIDIGDCIKDRNCILTSHGIVEAEAIPVFRAPTSDVSATLAFALISVLGTNILGLSALGFGYFKKYINLSNPIDFFVGLLELISEIGKIISFTFRLFGNVFAGEVLLLVMTSLTFGLATVPFLFLEVFVGFIQAFVFFMLSMVFISLAVTPHDHEKQLTIDN